MKNSRIWSGFSTLFASLLVISLLGQNLAMENASYINSALGVSTSKLVDIEAGEAVDTTYYKSQFGDFDDPAALQKLLAAEYEQNINEMREGAALLMNEKNTLPLTDAVRISVFGHAAVDPAYQSNSAGTKVTNETENAVTLKMALEAAGFVVNQELWDGIAAGEAKRGELNSRGRMSVNGSAKGSEENKAFYEALTGTFANDYKDAAIVMFARQGAEGTDLKMKDEDDEGGATGYISSLALHKNERDLLEMVRANFDKVVVLLNSPNQMEVHEIEPYADAILYIGFPGHQGFTGVAEILRGTVNPSGKLVDTYATSSLSAPAVVNSGTDTPTFLNLDYMHEKIGTAENADYMSFQAENIYIGYRYYETRYADAVMGKGNASGAAGASYGAASWKYADEVQYPFGYGLSYTTFEQTIDKVEMDNDTITVTVTVKNTGNVAGKSVAEIYAQTPYGAYEIEHKVEKSAIQLAGFAKTKLLAAGESETLTITIDKYLLASYDSTAHNGEGGYILSEGDYYIALGDDCHDALNNVLAAQGYTTADGMTADGVAAKAYRFSQSFDDQKYRTGANGVIVSNQFEECDLNYWIPNAAKYITRNDWEGTFPVAQTQVNVTDAMLDVLDGEWYVKPEGAPTYQEVADRFEKDSGLTLVMMKDVPLSDRETWEKFIYQLTVDELPAATAESFTCPAVGDLSPSFKVGDGCDSVGGSITRTVNGEEVKTATARYCSNPIMTGTWNVDIYTGRGTMMGEDGLWSGFMINYNVGNDLHRTPFGGRSFEYMSECPTMNYLAAIPQVEATEKTGSHAAPKHFVGNDQEFHREGVICFFTEQAFREGNLRAFEGSVRVAKSGGIMQSFERLGLRWSSASYAMNTQVLRNEWGWTGAIDTDAAGARGEFDDHVGYKNHSAEVLAAGTQEWCLDGSYGHGKAIVKRAQEEDDGHLMELLVDAAISWEYAISRSNIINGMSATAKVVQVTPEWQTQLRHTVIVLGVLAALCFVMLIASKLKKKA